MRNSLIVLALIAAIQLKSQTNTNIMRTIEVTGKSEKLIEPDEIIFTITIEEYWKEEFEGKKYEDYRTKIDIEGIEKSLISELKALNIGMDQITLKQAGNYWRQRGKDFLINKTIDVSLSDFAKANEIANTIKTRGVRNMHVSKLKHKDIEKIKLKVKAQAVKAAKEKAAVLASVMDKSIKDVVSIIEIDQYAHIAPRPNVAYARTAAMESADAGAVQYENFRKIRTEASVRVVFEVE